jgi:arabinogalactan endo-1,4-beta-galactosidase
MKEIKDEWSSSDQKDQEKLYNWMKKNQKKQREKLYNYHKDVMNLKRSKGSKLMEINGN